MLARKHKLPASFFRSIEKKKIRPSRIIAGRTCTIRCYTSDLPYTRVACVVPNGAFRTIVRRNAFRRFFYDEVKRAKLCAARNYDIVFLFGKGGPSSSGEAVGADITRVKEYL